MTGLYREQKARGLEKRSRQLTAERRKEWVGGAHELPGPALVRSSACAQDDGFQRAANESDWWAGLTREKVRLLTPARRSVLSSRAERSWRGRPMKERSARALPELAPSDLERRARKFQRRALLWFKPRTEREKAEEEEGSPWHMSRATGARTLFERVRKCADDPRRLVLTCRNDGCGNRLELKVGCDSQMFCVSCRLRRAIDFRNDFNRKRVGLMQAARFAGLRSRQIDRDAKCRCKDWHEAGLRRALREGTPKPLLRDYRTASHRMGERMLTLTLPHIGGPEQRIDTLEKTWAKFWRYFRDEYRPRLSKIKTTIRFDARTGEELPNGQTLSVWDLVHYLWVLEWTVGDDGLGNPHLHVWMFSTFVEFQWLRALWSRAYSEVRDDLLGPSVVTWIHSPLLMVNVKAPKVGKADLGDIASEMVKYLTKDWCEDGTKRARPEVFGRVFARLDGRRRRQTSSGLAWWALKEHKACQCCFHESSPTRHWAWVSIESPSHKKLKSPPPVMVFPDLATGPPLAKTRAVELRELEEADKERDWMEAPERLQLARVMRLALSLDE